MWCCLPNPELAGSLAGWLASAVVLVQYWTWTSTTAGISMLDDLCEWCQARLYAPAAALGLHRMCWGVSCRIVGVSAAAELACCCHADWLCRAVLPSPHCCCQVWLDQADGQVLTEGEEVTLMDWGNAIIKVGLCVWGSEKHVGPGGCRPPACVVMAYWIFVL